MHWTWQLVEAAGDDCYFRCEDSNTKFQEREKIGHMTTPKDHNSFMVLEPKYLEISSLPQGSRNKQQTKPNLNL